ncbi:MAG: ATP-binding cassette domain-containing protein [Oscillospiraceae bacterium]
MSDGEEWRLRREMAMLGLDEALLDRPFDSLSGGGERTKLQLAAMFANENDFLLIDEPTNHLDEAGRERVARYLRRKRGSSSRTTERFWTAALRPHSLDKPRGYRSDPRRHFHVA